MAFTSSLAPYSNQNTGSLRQWGSAVTNGCVAAGLVDVNPVGRIDWNTISPNGSTYFTYGFDVFALNDSLYPTHPIYIKLEYQNGTLSGAKPRITVTIGTTHNGSGSVGGNARTNTLQFTGGGVSTTPEPLYFAAGDGWGNILLWPDQSPQDVKFISIDRTRDANGNITPQGVLVNLMGSQNGNTPSQYYLPYTGPIPPLEARWGVIRSVISGDVRNDNRTAIGRIFHFDGAALPIPTTTLIGADPGQVAPGDVYDVPLFANITGSFLGFANNRIVTNNGIGINLRPQVRIF